MALDGIYLHAILNELRNKLINGRITKINQPEKDEINLTIRTTSLSNVKLLISASSSYPKIHITNLNKTNPIKAPMFCMVLRKHIMNSRIVNIEQLGTDRILIINVESVDELGFNSIYQLFIEIMGRHSNITLIRQRDNTIMDSIKHLTLDINRYRTLLPGLKFTYPPESTKLNPLNFSFEDFEKFILDKNINKSEKMFSSLFTGVSSTLSKELYFNTKDIMSNNELYIYLSKFFLNIKNNNFNFSLYSYNKSVKDFYCIKLLYLNEMDEKVYDSPSELLDDFYAEKDKIDRLNNKSSDLQKIIKNNIERCIKKDEIYNKKLKECDNKDIFRIYGELLTSNIYSIKKGDKVINVLNYYSENSECVDIKLDKNKTPSENIQAYFKKYNKLKKTEENALIQIENNNNELEYLQSVLTNIENSETYAEIEEIKQELIETGYIKFSKKNKVKKSKTSKPMHIKSKDNIDIYIGRNNYQNDYLTLKFADKRDIWLHTKNIPGSHVIIKNYGSVPDSTLEEAASLAAFYSKAKESLNVAVDYTEVKNVKKPSGAKPGMVIYYTNKTIYINPKAPKDKVEGTE